MGPISNGRQGKWKSERMIKEHIYLSSSSRIRWRAKQKRMKRKHLKINVVVILCTLKLTLILRLPKIMLIIQLLLKN